MQFFTTTAVMALLATAIAAPMPDAERDMMAAGKWTVQKMTRTCDAKNDSCKYSYSINTGSGAPQACSYTIMHATASRASYNNIHCGAFTISSNWSGQFGADKGFQTIAVVKGKQIIYAGYTDKQLPNGKTVQPDQSYTPQNLP